MSRQQEKLRREKEEKAKGSGRAAVIDEDQGKVQNRTSGTYHLSTV